MQFFVWVGVTLKEIFVGLINFFADVVGREGALHDICGDGGDDGIYKSEAAR